MQGVRSGPLGTESKTDKFDAVGVRVIPNVSFHILVFHPLGYDVKLDSINHLDSVDCQDVAVIDQFGNQDLLAKLLEIT